MGVVLLAVQPGLIFFRPNSADFFLLPKREREERRLLFGANDMGSLMIEENVVAEAGTVHYLTLDQIREAIEELGYQPRQRNVFYQLVGEEAEQRAILANRNQPPKELVQLAP